MVGMVLDRRVQWKILPIVLFIFIYSFLPHKELRFIFYAFPIFNFAAAVAIVRLYVRSFISFHFISFYFEEANWFAINKMMILI
jgi:alpha-1,6-mannosyltransferase